MVTKKIKVGQSNSKKKSGYKISKIKKMSQRYVKTAKEKKGTIERERDIVECITRRKRLIIKWLGCCPKDMRETHIE